MHVITEGKARFYASVADDKKISKELEVFYNPVMRFNRDVSVILLNFVPEKNLQIADIMAGSGVRSLRFLLELNPGKIKSIVVNDCDDGFVKLFEENMGLNDIAHTDRLITSSRDASILLLESHGFDYIDIDPFGSPNDFLDASIKRLSRGGILAVTATDTAPLCGTYPDACKRKYWARPLRNSMMHEIGLRILIRKVQLVGAAHDKALVPIYSYSKDHYFRIFFRCTKSKKSVDDVLLKHEYFLVCNKCLSFKTSKINHEKCSCGNGMGYAGPLWTGELYEKDLAQEILGRAGNIDAASRNFLNWIASESLVNIIGFYDIHAYCKHFKLNIPSFDRIFEEISAKDYFASRTHFSLTGIKTNMPADELRLVIGHSSESVIKSH